MPAADDNICKYFISSFKRFFHMLELKQSFVKATDRNDVIRAVTVDEVVRFNCA